MTPFDNRVYFKVNKEQFEVFNCPNRKQQDECQLSVSPRKKNDNVPTVWQNDRETEQTER